MANTDPERQQEREQSVSKIPLEVGAKTGACVGFVFGLTQAAIRYIVTPSIREPFSSSVQYTLGVAFVGAIGTALLGMLFVRIEWRLLGRSMIVKGIEFMFILWVVLRGFVVWYALGLSGFPLLLTALTLGSYAGAGAGLGYLVKKFSKRPVTPTISAK